MSAAIHTADSPPLPDARFWDGIAEMYAAKPVENQEAYANKLVITKGLLAPDHRVLDVGCGTGSLALELAPHVAHVDSMDISAEMLRIARGKAEAAGVTNVAFHLGTLNDGVPFAPGTYDCVCAYNILHLVHDRPELLAGLFSMLKPGGSFVSSTVVLGDSWVPYRAILTVMRWIGKAPRVHIAKTATVQAEMTAAGFVDIERPEVGAGPQTAFLTARRP